MVHGSVAPGFEGVRDAFAENFRKRGEVGAAVAVHLDGERVVDLWGGDADVEEGRPWQGDTLGVMFSATKGMTALCLLILVDRGKLDPDALVADYWPEFAANGKQGITVRTLMNHRGGLCAIDEPLALADFRDPDRVAQVLAAQAPAWEPGTAQGYHAIAMGPYAQELMRRVDGRTVGQFLAEEVSGPLGADVYLGLPEGLSARVATLYPISTSDKLLRVVPRALVGRDYNARLYRSFFSRNSLTRRAVQNPEELGPKGLHNYNDPDVHAMELPWANGIASARGLAAVYGALAGGGGDLIGAETLATVHPRQSWEQDRILHKPMGFSFGFVKEQPHIFSPNPEAFGHPGAGGVLGLADPTRKLSIAYLMNRMDYRLRSPRCMTLCKAVYAAL